MTSSTQAPLCVERTTSSAVTNSTEPPPAGFDYGSLPEPVRRHLQDKAAAIHGLLGSRLVMRTAAEVVQVGVRLYVVHEYVGKKSFGSWVSAEFQWERAAASKYMCSARAFQDVDCLDRFDPSALYVLARKKVPPAARAEALELARAGTWITCLLAEEIVGKHTGAPAAVRRLIRGVKEVEKALQKAGPRLDARARIAIQRLVSSLTAALNHADSGGIFHRKISSSARATRLTDGRPPRPSKPPEDETPTPLATL